jgi:hypothetical protein
MNDAGQLTNTKITTIKYIAIISFAFFCSLSLIVPLSFPFLAVAFIGIIFSLLIFKKSQKDTLTNIFFITSCLLSLCIFIYANYWVTFLNLIALIWSTSILALKGNNKVYHYIFAPFILIVKILTTKSKYQIGLKDILQLITGGEDLNKKQAIAETTKQTIIGLIISFILLAIIIPLLASSNIVFKSYSEKLFEFISKSFFQLFENNWTTLWIWIYRLFAFWLFCVLLPQFSTYNDSAYQEAIQQTIPENTTINNKLNLIALIPKLVISLVLVCFFISQIQLYFADSNYLAALGQSYGKINNEIFGQLLAVSSITFLMTFFDKTQNLFHRISSYILVALSLFLIFVAGKSDYEYIFHYGYTFKRLWGFVLLLLVLNSFLISVCRIHKNLNIHLAFKAVVINSLILLIGVNLINFDRLILLDMPHANDKRERVDYSYSNKLSVNVIDVRKLHDYQLKYQDSFMTRRYQTNDPIIDQSVEHLRSKYFQKYNYINGKYYEKCNFLDKIFCFNLVEYLAVQNAKKSSI